ncbi:hypothetical protein PTKIN_Ptkin02bG0178200 [Pterospermum kingtungense]
MTRMQQPDKLREKLDDEIKKLYQALEYEITSYGVIMNSFNELEPAYVEHNRWVHDSPRMELYAREYHCWSVPMLTWSLSNEQFYTEKLVTETLRIGVASESVLREMARRDVEEGGSSHANLKDLLMD